MNHSTKKTKKKIKHLDAHKESYALVGRKRYIRRVLYVDIRDVYLFFVLLF